MEVQCFGVRIALARATMKHFFALKKIHITIAKTTNHIRFLKRCMKHQIVPKGLTPKLPSDFKRSQHLKEEFGRRLVKERLNELWGKLARLQKEEVRLRCLVFSHTDLDQFSVLWDYIEVIAEQEHVKTKTRQIRKFDGLAEKQFNLKRVRSGNTCNTVINLSNRNLDSHEVSLLQKGLQFVPLTRSYNKVNLAAATELAIHLNKGNEQNVVSALMNQHSWEHLGKDNLTYLERRALSALKNDPSICILKADKGNAVVVMEKSEYEAKLEAIVFSENYTKLEKDPSNTIDNKLRKIVRDLKKLKNTPRNIASQIIGHNSRNPAIYGTPKIHKPDNPLRPIITTYGSVLEKCSTLVASVLKYYKDLRASSFSLLNTYELKSHLSTMHLPDRFTMVSFDVTNLFGSLDQEQCKRVVLTEVNKDPGFETRFQIPITYFEKVFNICLTMYFFEYKGCFFKQSSGIPMGAPCSPMIAELYLQDLEEKIRKLNYFHLVALWKRYLDDVLAFWTGTVRQLNIFLKLLNKVDNHIKFTMETEMDNSLPFLDIQMKKVDKGLEITMYTKPTDSGLVTNYNSFHPPGCKINIIQGEANRVLKLSDRPDHDLETLRDKLLCNDYPDKVITNTFKRCSNKSNNHDSNGEQRKVSLCLPYMGKLSNKISRAARKDNMKLVSSKNKNLGAMFSQNYKYSTSKRNNLVYKIPCSCGEIYVGETSKTLDKRISQHKYAITSGDTNNGIAVHSMETGHPMQWDKAEILSFETNYKLRKIKEATFIQKLNPKLNLNTGFQLQKQWSTFVS